MNFKDGLKQAKISSVHFWFCEKGPDGKPLLMTDKKKIPPSEIATTLKTCKSKSACTGTMAVDEEGTLNLTPHAKPPAQMAKGVQIVARENNAMPKAIAVLEPVEPTESTEDGSVNTSDPGDQVSPAAELSTSTTTSPGDAAGLRTKSLPPKYAGEDKSQGWRVEGLSQDQLQTIATKFSAARTKAAGSPITVTIDEARAILAANKSLVTKYFDEDERAASAVSFDETGGAYAEEGTRRLDADRTSTDPVTYGHVLSPEGTLHSFEQYMRKGPNNQKQAMHHSTPLAGGDVAGAGHISVEDGHIVQIDDQSGHYKPDSGMTHQTVETLHEQGGLVDKRLGDDSGNVLRGGTGHYLAISDEIAGQATALHAEMQAVMLLDRDDPSHEKRTVALQKAVAELDKAAAAAIERMSPEERARRGLQGVGPVNTEAKVNLLDKNAGLSDAQYASVRELPPPDRAEAMKTLIQRNALRQPLGEEEYGKLVKRSTLVGILEAAQKAGGEKLAAVMGKVGVDSPQALAAKIDELKREMGASSIDELKAQHGAVSIDQLKAALGENAVRKAEADPDELEKLIAKHGITAPVISEGDIQVTANFKGGEAGALELTAGQFMQTGGNENQARIKKALNAEITERSSQPAPAVSPSAINYGIYRDDNTYGELADSGEKSTYLDSSSLELDPADRSGYLDSSGVEPADTDDEGATPSPNVEVQPKTESLYGENVPANPAPLADGNSYISLAGEPDPLSNDGGSYSQSLLEPEAAGTPHATGKG